MRAVESREAQLLESLREVQDPELPVSIVDLGLVVALRQSAGKVDVKITFTSMGCPGMEMILDDVRERLLAEPDVTDVAIEIVWDPIWTKDRLSPDARLQLRAWGLAL